MKRTKSTSRDFEVILGVVGSVIALFSGSLIFVIENFSLHNTPFFGIIGIIAFILGTLSTFYVKKNSEIAGFGFIISSVLVILSSSYMSILAAIFLLICGISSLFRK